MIKAKQYSFLIEETKSLINKDVDDIANMANLSRLLYERLSHHWVGFYRVIEDQLILGPFNGPIACTSIAFGKGVCGKSWQHKKTYVVNDVHQFDGHIACSPLSNSEIVVPCIRNNHVFAVLDIDSTKLNEFDHEDQYYLEQIVALL
ncbi:MAG: GAF domain-containing protein [Bacteroidia bacterium]|nr:GAF domain-containing protein [Bacteroidia bacterium]|tara:strand:- start:2045 stop:2485 length:441 start_codon:yes stop_codon:yes gene_type:complete